MNDNNLRTYWFQAGLDGTAHSIKSADIKFPPPVDGPMRKSGTELEWDDYMGEWILKRVQVPPRYPSRPELGSLSMPVVAIGDKEPNLVSSRLENGKHAPAIDLDVPHEYVPSSTLGHGHLYINVELPWWKYRVLLWALKLCGIIEKGFYNSSVKRKQSMLRLPGAKKGGCK
jgi:hypothetical protein